MNILTRREFLASSAAVALSSSLRTTALAAEPAADDPANWGQFLGPRRDAISRETGLNTDWKAKKPPVAWKMALGPGFSSVAVVEDRVYTMCKRADRDVAVCLDSKSGKELWSHDGAPSYIDKQRQGPGPRSTPTYHQGKLYCLFPMGDLLCLNAADGKQLWKSNIFETAGAKNPAGAF